MKVFISLVMVIAIQTSLRADSEPITVHKAAALLTKHCAGCHQTEKHPGAAFLNEAKLSTEDTMKLLIRLMETGQMPPVHKHFAESSDGKKLLAWLKSELPKKKN